MPQDTREELIYWLSDYYYNLYSDGNILYGKNTPETKILDFLIAKEEAWREEGYQQAIKEGMELIDKVPSMKDMGGLFERLRALAMLNSLKEKNYQNNCEKCQKYKPNKGEVLSIHPDAICHCN